LPTPVPAGSVRHTEGCIRPVLRGRADHIDSGTGELIHRYTTVHERPPTKAALLATSLAKEPLPHRGRGCDLARSEGSKPPTF